MASDDRVTCPNPMCEKTFLDKDKEIKTLREKISRVVNRFRGLSGELITEKLHSDNVEWCLEQQLIKNEELLETDKLHLGIIDTQNRRIKILSDKLEKAKGIINTLQPKLGSNSKKEKSK
jgi:predicted RNase H-like nuclease (RuvC/YqgF family)